MLNWENYMQANKSNSKNVSDLWQKMPIFVQSVQKDKKMRKNSCVQ